MYWLDTNFQGGVTKMNLLITNFFQVEIKIWVILYSKKEKKFVGKSQTKIKEIPIHFWPKKKLEQGNFSYVRGNDGWLLVAEISFRNLYMTRFYCRKVFSSGVDCSVHSNLSADSITYFPDNMFLFYSIILKPLHNLLTIVGSY